MRVLPPTKAITTARASVITGSCWLLMSNTQKNRSHVPQVSLVAYDWQAMSDSLTLADGLLAKPTSEGLSMISRLLSSWHTAMECTNICKYESNIKPKLAHVNMYIKKYACQPVKMFGYKKQYSCRFEFACIHEGAHGPTNHERADSPSIPGFLVLGSLENTFCLLVSGSFR